MENNNEVKSARMGFSEQTSVMEVNQARALQLPRSLFRVPTGGQEFVRWGEMDRLPDRFVELSATCSLMNSILDLDASMTMGDEIVFADAIKGFSERENAFGDTLTDVLDKVIRDYDLFHMAAICVERNMMGEIVELQHVPCELVRVNKDYTKVKVWRDSSRSKFDIFPVWSANLDYTTSIFIISGMRRGVYPIPRWFAAMSSIEAFVRSNEYSLNSTIRSFSPPYIVNWGVAVDSEKERKAIYKEFLDSFCGSSNSGLPMLVFNSGQEDRATISAVPANNTFALYDGIRKSVIKDILTGFRCPACLLGLDAEGNTLIEDGSKMTQAVNLYNRNVIVPMQNEIQRALKKILGGDFITFKPYAVEQVQSGQAPEMTQSTTNSTTEAITEVEEEKNISHEEPETFISNEGV